jgi:hypothetical protein
MEQSLDKFEEIIEKLATNILVQNFLLLDQIMNNENIIIAAPSQDYKPLGLFQDQNNEDCNYPPLFFGMFQKPSIMANFIKIIDLIDTYQNYFLRSLRFIYKSSHLPLGSKYVKAS